MFRTAFLLLLVFKLDGVLAQVDSCKTVGSCALWASNKTGIKYDLGKFERRPLKLDREFNFKDGDPDIVFNYILQSNDLARIKRDAETYQVIAMKDLKDFRVPIVKPEELPVSLDFYSVEFSLTSKEQVKNTLVMVKKLLSKNGKVLEVADSPKIQIMDSGIHLNSIKLFITVLYK